MLKDVYQKYYFEQNYNCAETLLRAANDYYVEAKAHESEDIRPVVMKLMRKFNAKYGSTLCKDIKPQSFKPEYRCKMTVETACDILEETIKEYEEEKKA